MAENNNNQNAQIAATELSRVIEKGEEVKYFISIDQEGFDMTDNDFTVELRWGMRVKSMLLTKQDMTLDSSGKYFFGFNTKEMIGKITAVCKYYVPDVDDPDGVREKVDEQVIAFVVNTPCPQFLMCPKCSATGHNVTYERTDDSGIASRYQRLCTTLGQPLVTDDDLYLYVLTSPEETSTSDI